MAMTGRCYCGDVHYAAEGAVMMKFECYCRECQYISGGGPVMGMAVPVEGYTLTKGAVKGFTRTDIEGGVTREFCANCGTHIATRAPGFPQGVIIKIGSLDNQADFGGADFAAYACDAQEYHRLPKDVPVRQRWFA